MLGNMAYHPVAMAALLLATTCSLTLSACKPDGGNGGALPAANTHASLTSSCYDDPLVAQSVHGVHRTAVNEVVVLYDRTTPLPEDVLRAVERDLATLIQPRTQFTLASFSTYSAAEHNRIELSFFVDPPLSDDQTENAGMGAMRRLNSCLAARGQAIQTTLQTKIRQLAESATTNSQRSDIVAAVTAFGQQFSNSHARHRTFVLISDLLENSSVSSFYSNGTMRTIDVTQELAKFDRAGLTPRLVGARVFVVGAGIVPAGAENMRSNDEMRALTQFWTQIFTNGGAESVQIGQPLLLTPVAQ